jgi:hypothetical protein
MRTRMLLEPEMDSQAINIWLRWSPDCICSTNPDVYQALTVTEVVLRESHQISIRFAAGPTKNSAKIGAYTT